MAKRKDDIHSSLATAKLELTTMYEGDFDGDMQLSTFIETQRALLRLIRIAGEYHDPSFTFEARISTVKKGSFELGTLLNVGFSTAFAADPQATMTAIWNMVKGIISLRKFLGGKPPQQVEKQPDGSLMVKSNLGTINYFPNAVFSVSGDNSSNSVFGDLGKALYRDGDVTSFAVHPKDDPESGVRVEQAEFHPISVRMPTQQVTEEQTYLDEMSLIIKRLDIIPDGVSEWEFIDNRGNSVRAVLLDEAFLTRVRQHQASFRNGDRLVVMLETVTQTTTDDPRPRSVSNRIIEVIRHEPYRAPDQLLFEE